MSDSLQTHRLQHARLSCPPLSSGVCSNSCPWGIVNEARGFSEIPFFLWCNGCWQWFLYLFQTHLEHLEVMLKPSLKILSITLLACEMSTIVGQFEHSLDCPSLGLEWNLTFYSPMATAESSKFAGTLTAPSFRIWNNSAGILLLPLVLILVMLPQAHMTSHSSMSGSI